MRSRYWDNHQETWREKQLWLMHLTFETPPRLNPAILGYVHRWKHPSNYMGATWYDYCICCGQSRDSEALEQSNFRVALEMLGGEDGEDVIVVRENHWAVGWVEWLAIHREAWDKLEIAEHIGECIDDYPALDEDDWQELENEQYEEYVDALFKDPRKLERFYEMVGDSNTDCGTVDTLDIELVDYVNDHVFLRKYPVPSERAVDDDGNMWLPLENQECSQCWDTVGPGYYPEGTDPEETFLCMECIHWDERMVDENQLELAM